MESYPSNTVNTNIPRYDKAFKNIDKVEALDETKKLALVRSSDGNKLYEVNFDRIINDQLVNDCNCPDNTYRYVECWHIHATQLKRKINSGELKPQ